MKPISLKFCAPFKILYRNGREEEERKSKVRLLDTQIK